MLSPYRTAGLAGLLAAALVPAAVAGPQNEPFPRLDANLGCRAIAVLVRFDSATQVRFLSARVIQSCPPERVGAPPLLKLRIASAGDCAIEELYSWHPLQGFDMDMDGERMHKVASAEGRFIIPFYPMARTLEIIDVPRNRSLITVDIAKAIDAYCAENAGDIIACGLRGPLTLSPRFLFSLELLQRRELVPGQELSSIVRGRVCNVGGSTAENPSGPAVDGPVDVDLVPVGGGITVGPGAGGASVPHLDARAALRTRALESTAPLKFKEKRLKAGRAEAIKLRARVPADTPPGQYCLRLTQGDGGARSECVPVTVVAR
jgi:hypothetical protein